MFTCLDEVTRSIILEEPVGEIVLMLEQNILSKFKLTPAMQQRERRKLVEIGGLKTERSQNSATRNHTPTGGWQIFSTTICTTFRAICTSR